MPASSKFGLSRIPVGVLDMLSVWFELRSARSRCCCSACSAPGIFAIGAIAGLVALAWLAIFRVGIRPVWTLIQTCLILGSIFFATGLLGEQIAGQRAELREIRRQLDAVRASQDNAASGDEEV